MVSYKRNLVHGMCGVVVPGKAILSNTTFVF